MNFGYGDPLKSGYWESFGRTNRNAKPGISDEDSLAGKILLVIISIIAGSFFGFTVFTLVAVFSKNFWLAIISGSASALVLIVGYIIMIFRKDLHWLKGEKI